LEDAKGVANGKDVQGTSPANPTLFSKRGNHDQLRTSKKKLSLFDSIHRLLKIAATFAGRKKTICRRGDSQVGQQ